MLISGLFKCDLCNEKFMSKELALEHINTNHSDLHDSSDDGGDDFEASSDASIDENEEESDFSDAEGSSCVESSDVQSGNDEDDNDDADDDANSVFVSKRKGKASAADSQEVKNARKLLSTYVETFSGNKIASKTIKWTKEL